MANRNKNKAQANKAQQQKSQQAAKAAAATTPPGTTMDTQQTPTPPAPVQDTPATQAASTTSNGAAKNYSEAYRKRMVMLPVHLRTTTKLRRSVERLGEYARQAKRFDEKAVELITSGERTAPSELIIEADGLLQQAIKMLEAVPEDYTPPRKLAGAAAAKAGTGGGNIQVGNTVAIREKRRSAYTDDLTAEEMQGLTVADMRKNKVICTTTSGVKVFIPRAHLEPVQAAS